MNNFIIFVFSGLSFILEQRIKVMQRDICDIIYIFTNNHGSIYLIFGSVIWLSF